MTSATASPRPEAGRQDEVTRALTGGSIGTGRRLRNGAASVLMVVAFLAAAVPLHALHYLCGAAGFAAGAALHLLAPGRSGRAAAPVGPAPELAPAPVDAER